MTELLIKLRTVCSLGWGNVARVLSYRLGIKLGLKLVCQLETVKPQGPFFITEKSTGVAISAPIASWKSEAKLFGHLPFRLSDAPPDWLINPFNGQRITSSDLNWWEIPDFDPTVGDIKLIWELSRMDWVLAFAQRAHQGDQLSLNRLNDWLTDWCQSNPPYKGPNWKCGQEASIRLMHLAMASLILGEVGTTTCGLQDLIRVHLKRIAPTIQYAIAQDNNHGTSEAAALFIGGSWLAALGIEEGKDWERIGRRWLENRARRLICPDGSFSQYSLNYHRMMLDTFCMVEVWRRYLYLPTFSVQWQSRALNASKWLYNMINHANGEGPNVGGNDGAHLLQLADTPYRDHRPSVTLAMALFAKQRAYSTPGPWEHSLKWLRVEMPQTLAPLPQTFIADDGGFAVLRCGDIMAMMRYPRFRFRPSQADALHIDLWLGSDNLLRDAGTYSYNTDSFWLNYFSGTASHNTIQFDERDQMPRLSRFLFGSWLKTDLMQLLPGDDQEQQLVAGYQDSHGASHHRQLSLSPGFLQVVDKVKNFRSKAVIRWRLKPGDWRLNFSQQGVHLTLDAEESFTLSLSASAQIMRCELVEGWESLHYLSKTTLPVLEVEVHQACTITTKVIWLP